MRYQLIVKGSRGDALIRADHELGSWYCHTSDEIFDGRETKIICAPSVSLFLDVDDVLSAEIARREFEDKLRTWMQNDPPFEVGSLVHWKPIP